MKDQTKLVNDNQKNIALMFNDYEDQRQANKEMQHAISALAKGINPNSTLESKMTQTKWKQPETKGCPSCEKNQGGSLNKRTKAKAGYADQSNFKKVEMSAFEEDNPILDCSENSHILTFISWQIWKR